MGTAVLLPQDCLRHRSRYKHQASGMIYPADCMPRSKRNPPTLGPSQEAGLLPLPGHCGHSLPMTIPRRGSDLKHFTARKVSEQRDSNSPSKGDPDVPAYRILQRPKQEETAIELLAHFVMLDGAKAGSVIELPKNPSVKGPQIEDLADKYLAAQNGALDMKVDGTGTKFKNRGLDSKMVEVSDEGGSVCQSAGVCMLKDASKHTTGIVTSISEGCKPSNLKGGIPKPKNVVMKEKVQSGPDNLASSQFAFTSTPSRVIAKPYMSKASGKMNDVTYKAMIVQRTDVNETILSRGLARLRRTSTEPQMATHIVGQYRNKVMHISFSDSRLGSHAHNHGCSKNSEPLSCQERWAGPAYTSSPSPSSLPLPKLCLPHSRFSSLELPPLVKQYSTSVYVQPFLGSSAPTFVASENGGTWDVAFATKSLRKMLNLDCC